MATCELLIYGASMFVLQRAQLNVHSISVIELYLRETC